VEYHCQVEAANLAECHQPLLWLLDAIRPAGRIMAQRCGCGGFTGGSCAVRYDTRSARFDTQPGSMLIVGPELTTE